MPSISMNNCTVNFSISAKDSSGRFTISATFTGKVAPINDVHLSCSLTNGSPWSRIDVGYLAVGETKSGSVTISSGNTASQNVYCYLLYGGLSSGSGGAYNVPAYVPPTPPTPTYYDHTITFYGNGGTNIPSPQTITNTSRNSFTATLPSQTPTKSGFSFLGYSENSEATTADYLPNTQYTFNKENVNLYAIFYAQRTITIQKVGSGTIKINGTVVSSSITLPYGTQVTATITPDTSNYYYTSKIVWNGETFPIEPTTETLKGTMPLLDSGTLRVEFAVRSQHTLSVTSEYEIEGTGTYRYLDKPVLLAKIGSLIAFNGWYEGDVLKSSTNPYTFTMPDNDVTLTIEVGSPVFSNQRVRQFAIQNGNGEVFSSPNRAFEVFLDSPKNLGFSKTIKTTRLGNAEVLASEKYNMPQPNGTLIFHKNSISGKYEDYNYVMRFLSKKPLTLYYKIPTTQGENEFHIPIEVISVGKEEVNNQNVLAVPISLYGTNFWQSTQTQTSTDADSVQLYNDSDFEVGVKITCRKLDSSDFSNPKISFKQGNKEYGAIAIDFEDLTKIEIDTRDKNQMIKLYVGSQLVPNPFAYIDFGYADGEKQFPFPKLSQGYSTIRFTFDGDTSTDKVYLVEYDKEYLSV